ncbi:MAG TPA: ABC transporter substrate-binding protein [Oscillospiraceae bacterium]|nr:ABC transporter substrate-binding protein [Oscillospiraceae bacterium]
MANFKKAIAVVLGVLVAGSFAACASNKTSSDASSAQTSSSESKAESSAEKKSDGPVTIKISWWGGDSRHKATQDAIKKFMEKNPNITVETQFGAWDGWEDAMSTAFYAGTAPDVNQINWNWITSFSSDGKMFLDMNTVKDTFDLSQYDKSALEQCTVANKLQAVPVAMSGRIFYWNKTVFEKAGISTPKSLAELYAAGETFKTKLGDEYYPLALGEYDRMILMVYYLESVYGKAWVVDGKLNYSQEEIEKGLEFIKSLEDKHVTPSIKTILGDGAASLDKNPKWIEGKYAGIFEWDSSAGKFKDSLTEGQEFVVGDYFEDFGKNHGGFSKVSLAFAITNTTKYPTECAMLMQYLLNDPEGAKIMGSERGIPLSKSAFKACEDAGILNETVKEANGKVLSWVSFPLDPQFENSKLKGNPDGVYYDVMSGISYGEYSISDGAKVLIDGINGVLKG